jgi:hypothetical protein
MWYLILWLLIALWVLFDARKRRNNFIGWAIGTFLLGPIVMSIYLAKRNLKENEVREGGTGWNILKYFTLYWTISMAVVAIAGMIGAGSVFNSAENELEQAGAIIGAGIGLSMIFFLWLIVAVIALVLGFFLKKSSVIEKGPTGPLANNQTQALQQ